MSAVATAAPVDTSRATQYARAVTAGDVVAGKLVRLACERHLRMLAACETGISSDIRWNAEVAERIVRFYGQLLQYQGRWAGKPLALLDWQAFCVQSIVAWQRFDSLLGLWVRLYREVYISVGRKNGKTTLASGLALWLLDFDGEDAAQVYFAASKRDQAKQGFESARAIVRQNPGLQRRMKDMASTSRIVVPDTSSVLLPLGRDADSEHGLNVHAAFVDELHILRNRDMVDALDTATGARVQPVMAYTTTAGVEGATIYCETDDRARRVVSGASIDPAMFVYLATLDEEDDWRDPTVYAKANPSLGAILQAEDLEAELRKAQTIPGRQAAFKRLRLNMRTHTETVWMPLDLWDAAVVPELHGRGKRVIGVDLGATMDLSAAAAITADEGGIDIDIRFWMPEDLVQASEERDRVPYQAWADEGWLTLTPGDYRDDRAIADDLSEWHSGAIEFDLDKWNSSTLTTILRERGFTVVLVEQTYRQLTPAVAMLEKVVASGQLRHLGNPILRWMLTNTALEEHADGGRKPIKKERGQRRRIDGVSAILDALSRLSDAELPPAAVAWGFGAI